MNNEFYNFQNSKPENIVVLDAGALIAGLNIQIIDNTSCYTTQEIINEVKNKNVQLKMDYYNEFNSIQIIDVPLEFIDLIKKKSNISGDFKFLSENDIRILACAQYLKESYSKYFNSPLENVPIILISDDYSIQNTAKILGLKTRGYKTKGIKKFIKWELYCPNCKKRYNNDYNFDDCEICGSVLKRRPLRSKINRR